MIGRRRRRCRTKEKTSRSLSLSHSRSCSRLKALRPNPGRWTLYLRQTPACSRPEVHHSLCVFSRAPNSVTGSYHLSFLLFTRTSYLLLLIYHVVCATILLYCFTLSFYCIVLRCYSTVSFCAPIHSYRSKFESYAHHLPTLLCQFMALCVYAKRGPLPPSLISWFKTPVVVPRFYASARNTATT